MEKQIKKTSKFYIPSIAAVIFLIIFFLLSFREGEGLLQDCDTGYHIRAGEYIMDSLSIPKHDIFSFITPAILWTAHEWLSEVVMALVHRLYGLTGIVIFFSFVIALIYYVLFKIFRTYSGNILICILVALFVITSSQIHWLARPHIFALFLFITWYYLLDIYQYKNKNYLYLFPLIMLFWVNLHGGFIIGFVIIGIYLSGNLMKFFTSKGIEREDCKKKAKLLGLITLVCLAVSLFNPYGYHILLFPLKLTFNTFLMDHVHEFLSPDFHEPMPYKYLLLLMITIFAVSIKRVNSIELILIILFTYMSIYSARYIPLFAVITAPILLRQTDFMFEKWDGRIKNFFKKRDERIASVDASANGYVWLSVAVVIVILFVLSGKIAYTFDEEKTPVLAVEFLKKEHINGNMFNNDEFGDYIIYAAWPEYKVFFDGRSDMYGEERMREYFQVTGLKLGWEKVLKKYNMNWIFFDNNSALSNFLYNHDDWKLVYADNVANIFVKNIPDNRSLIEKYPNVKLHTEKDNKET